LRFSASTSGIVGGGITGGLAGSGLAAIGAGAGSGFFGAWACVAGVAEDQRSENEAGES
jgi:hypothetical protein